MPARKGKAKKGANKLDDSDDDEPAKPAKGPTSKKAKGKKGRGDDDSEEEEEVVKPAGKAKKGKKKMAEDSDDEVEPVKPAQKGKKGRKKGGDESDEDEEIAKPAKGKRGRRRETTARTTMSLPNQQKERREGKKEAMTATMRTRRSPSRPKAGKAGKRETESDENEEDAKPTAKAKKGKKKAGDESDDEDDVKLAKGKKGKKTAAGDESDEEEARQPVTKGKKGRKKREMRVRMRRKTSCYSLNENKRRVEACSTRVVMRMTRCLLLLPCRRKRKTRNRRTPTTKMCPRLPRKRWAVSHSLMLVMTTDDVEDVDSAKEDVEEQEEKDDDELEKMLEELTLEIEGKKPPPTKESLAAAAAAAGQEGEEGEAKEAMTGKKKKKKDKKAAAQDEPLEGAEEAKELKDEAAAPAAESKKAKKIAAIQEHLRKLKEEEERRKQEEEEKIKAEEEAERLREEKLKQEQERKERKKQKEKERRERAKAEGRLLTKAQKMARARMEATLKTLKEQGIEVPQIGEKKEKTSRTMDRRNRNQRKKPEEEEKKVDETVPQVQLEILGPDTTAATEQKEMSPTEPPPEEKEDVKDAWDETSSEEEDDEEETIEEKMKMDIKVQVKTEAPKKAVAQKKAPQPAKKRNESSSSESDDDESSSEESSDEDSSESEDDKSHSKEKVIARLRFSNKPLKIPGLLIIDTPGHESFSNLRSRGSSLCDMAILVVDLMHGLEPQTIESLNMLRSRKTPFVVALNKVDRLYDWKGNRNKDITDVLKAQSRNTRLEFEERTREVVLQFAEQGLNAALFHENKDLKSFVSLVPTSALSGDGMGNLISLIVDLTQNMMAKRIAFSEELQATVLEVKAIPGLGTTIDVILVNGTLREGDTMVLAGHEGPFTTPIRSLLMPQPMKELRVKNPYQEYKEVKGAQGVKIAAKDLDKAIAGLQVLVAKHPDEVEVLKEEVARALKEVMSGFKLAERGVYVQASTLGSLEALLEFLRVSKIPYSGIRIGPVVKKDVMKASIMLEHDNQEELRQKKREEFKSVAVFPCRLRILPQFVFNSRDPIVVGVSVEAGIVKEGTPLCVPSKEFLDIGIVTTIEVNHKTIESARKGQEVCIKIEPLGGEAPKMYGRHFDHTDFLVSKISRASIDACKEYFRDDLVKTDWQLMVELKKLFQIL
ncbi:hypothetical protein HPB49_023029 [Dermacentor silvarum]|uniref:Uncharacterized protein n=1 Tax=Dermacentor silvarum TaxID=543639 RepID=A0ACB8D0R4_DERSI|nr:hypothetical protein HPB49_023029 [Dermacentor silvarum]